MLVLSLDLSTSCTGFAFFKDEKLTQHGHIKPKVKGISKLTYPEGALRKMHSLSEQVYEMVIQNKPDLIVIEEINRGKNRLGQKVLDGLHFIILDALDELGYLPRTHYIDSDGLSGWR